MCGVGRERSRRRALSINLKDVKQTRRLFCGLVLTGSTYGAETYSIRGRTSDEAQTGIADVTVEVRDVSFRTTHKARTNGSGDYLIDGLKAGRYRVWIESGPFYAIRKWIKVGPDQTFSPTLYVRMSDVRGDLRPEIFGVITDLNRVAIPGSRVHIIDQDEDRKAHFDSAINPKVEADGFFLAEVREATYHIRVNADDYKPLERIVTLKKQESVRIDARLEPA